MSTYSAHSTQQSDIAKSRRGLGKIIVLLGMAMVASGLASLSVAAIPSLERQSLASLYGNTDGINWNNTKNNFDPWFANTDECTWYGIICSDPDMLGMKHVTRIFLLNNNLSGGELGKEIYLGYLTKLEILELGNNVLTSFPDLSGLPALERLNVSANQLTSFPNLSNLPALTQLNVSANQLTSFPNLSNLPALTQLDVSDNHLGNFPALTNLPTLEILIVRNNNLASFPILTNLPSLKYLDVSVNHLTEPPILTELALLSELSTLYIEGNQLTSFPNLTNVPLLQVLRVDSNNIHGPVPPAPANLRAGFSQLCPNPFDLTPSANGAAWDLATGALAPNHWWNRDTSFNCDNIFIGNFES